jgi:hypothetical protein
LIRIVCKELESWFLGDLEAVGLAYDVSLQQLQNKLKYASLLKCGKQWYNVV